MLLYCHICEVHKLVVHLSDLRAILDVAEASKAKLRHIHLQTANIAVVLSSLIQSLGHPCTSLCYTSAIEGSAL